MPENKETNYSENRLTALDNALAEQWLIRGQASKQVEVADRQIACIQHRIDEVHRAVQAEKDAETRRKAEEEERLKAEEKKGEGGPDGSQEVKTEN